MREGCKTFVPLLHNLLTSSFNKFCSGYISVFRQPRIQTGQYLDKYCFNQPESRQRRS